MDLLVALAIEGPMRRADITKETGRQSLDQLHVSDRAALLCRWRLTPTWRGYALALNPAFPHHAALRTFLRALGQTFPLRYKARASSKLEPVPTSAERYGDIVHLLGSPVRTMTLLTLELLGGRANQRDVYRIVPDHTRSTIKNVLSFYVSEGVLVKRGSVMAFGNRRWMRPFRALLRGVARENRELMWRVRERIGPGGKSLDVEEDHKTGLLGFKSFERLLMELAVRGPTNWAGAYGPSKALAEKGVQVYRRLGIVISRKHGRLRFLSLNAAHPVYRELRALLIAMSGRLREGLVEDWEDRTANFRVNRIFLQDLRTSVLCTVAELSRLGVDAATISRLLPQFDTMRIRKALKQYESLGIMRTRKGRGRMLYSLDELWEYSRELRPLIRAINAEWPEWKNAAAVAWRLQNRSPRRPSGRVPANRARRR